MYWSASAGVHEVHGAIWSKYKGLGGPAGFLGFPITDEQSIVNNIDGPLVTVGATNNFQHGEIVWNNGNVSGGRTGTSWMDPSIAALWNRQSFPYYGMPTKDKVAVPGSHVPGARVVVFDGPADIFTSPSTGTHAVITGDALVRSGDILTEYNLTGGGSGYLGLPTNNEVGAPTTSVPDGSEQRFQGGAIFQPGFGASFGPHAVHGAIYRTFSHDGGVAKFGYPTYDEQAAPGGRISHFQHGSIYWNATTDKTTITLS